MKIGKFIPLGDHKDVKVGYGTVDFKNLKTVYIKMNAWVEPDNEDEDFDKTISRTRKKIKDFIIAVGISDIHEYPICTTWSTPLDLEAGNYRAFFTEENFWI